MPWPAIAKPPSGDGTNRLGPCSASRPCAATRAVAGAAAISTLGSAQADATATTCKRLGFQGGGGQGGAGREMLHGHVVVRDGHGVRKLVPRAVADDGEPHAAVLGHAE